MTGAPAPTTVTLKVSESGLKGASMSVEITDRLRPAIHPTYPRLLCAYLHDRGFDNTVIFQDTRLQWEQPCLLYTSDAADE